MAQAKTLELSLLSENKLDPGAHDGLVTYNPSVDLFARLAGPKTLEVRRTNGQTVIKCSQRGENESVDALRWRQDGQFLAVGWSDGFVRLMGLESSKPVHQIPICEDSKAKITYIGWTQNRAAERLATNPDSTASLFQDLSLDGSSIGGNKSQVDLPRELTFLEIETALPKISPLPASGGSGDDNYVFTTRASLEFIFKPFDHSTSDKIDVMVVGTDDAQVHLSIFDSFVIGKFQYSMPDRMGSSGTLRLSHHASHSQLSTHSLIFQPTATKERARKFFLVPMDLTFIYSTPEHLSLIATKTTTLQKLLRYIKQVQTHMTYEWHSTRELPTKFLRNINETLGESKDYANMTITQAMYHLIVTGHNFPEVKEWLVDQLAERGHKRWDKAVVSGLDNLRQLVHENFLPALERISIILSRLLGIARFDESKGEIGFTSKQITQVMDIVSSMTLVGNKVLLLLMEELDLFQAFSGWLRHEIDRAASSSNSDELTEREATMEHGKILAYIQHYMNDSPLRLYLSQIQDPLQDRELVEDGSSLIDLLDKQIAQHEAGQTQATSFSQVGFLSPYLLSKTDSVFMGIAEAKRRSVRFGQPAVVEAPYDISKFDVKMCSFKQENGLNGVTYVALISDQREHDITLIQNEISIVNGINSTVVTRASTLSLGDAQVIDAKFLNENTLLALLSLENKIYLIRIPYQSPDLGYKVLELSPTPGEPADAFSNIHQLSSEQVVTVFPHVIVPGDTTHSATPIPIKMEVKGLSEERGKFPARICLLGPGNATYRVFQLPEDWDGKP